ncbi:uncharacterized protein LOC114544623 [Dendronephthya gigantea]|uniref:uncharacterized protein LOC114544623 n=1 Tax=Dendronephthya gigantea TaxID=151771 RepID=UPI00106DAA78|nr:uncharacterized protein LOC114544623 [Dendronephthya gigantea]
MKMLAKLSVLVLFQIIAITYGGVLSFANSDDDDDCTGWFVNCTTHEECCGYMRCIDAGDRQICAFGTDNPQTNNKPGEAIQPPIDIINDLGCSLYGQSCKDQNCCAPHVCSSDWTCKEKEMDFWGIGIPGAGYLGK